MQIQQTKQEGLKRIFESTISYQEFVQKETEQLNNIAKTVSIKGFRKGKVPLDIVKKNYQANATANTVEALVKQTLLSINKEHKISPVATPKVNIIKGEIGKEEDITLQVEFEVYPDVPNINFKEINIHKNNITISEEDINQFLKSLGEHYYNYADVTEKRPLQKGDIANINFVGTVDGKEFDGGDAKDFKLELGSKTFIDNFEEQLIGLEPGQTVEIKVNFPKEYPSKPELAGQPAIFKVEILGIKAKKPTTIEDLPKTLGIPSLEVLKEDVKARYSQQYNEMTNSQLRNQLSEALYQKLDFLLPETLVKKEIEALEAEFNKYLETKDKNSVYHGKNEEEVKKYNKELAHKRIKLSLILNAIAEENNIHVLPVEVDQFIYRESMKYPHKQKEIIHTYKSNPTIINNINSIIMQDKIFSYLLANVNVIETNLSINEYNQKLTQADDTSAINN